MKAILQTWNGYGLHDAGEGGLSDPKAMRALAHPARLAILTRLEGSATATEVAEVAGITPSAASYHLRMLAKYGFVEDAPPRGDGGSGSVGPRRVRPDRSAREAGRSAGGA